jgi:hypothetical protein
MKKRVQEDGVINGVRRDEVIEALVSLETSSIYLTESVKRYNIDKWPDSQTTFIDFHMNYLRTHPTLDPYQYISNLKLILKKTAR